MSYIPARPKRARPDFSLTIINIVFLLLLFYLATGSLIQQAELETDAPVTAELPLEKLPRPLLLLAADGSLALDGRPLAPADLAAAARTAAANAPYLNVLAERTAPARGLLDLLARLDAAGVPIRLVTLRESTK